MILLHFLCVKVWFFLLDFDINAYIPQIIDIYEEINLISELSNRLKIRAVSDYLFLKLHNI